MDWQNTKDIQHLCIEKQLLNLNQALFTDKPLQALKNTCLSNLSKSENIKIGYIGELYARFYLENFKRYEFYQSNYKLPFGEIDLILKDKNDLVIVEVKTRKYKKFDKIDIFSNITTKKKSTLRKLAFALQENAKQKTGLLFGIRIDLVGIYICPIDYSIKKIEHLISAI